MDDLYQNSGESYEPYYPDAPKEQVAKEIEAKGKKAASYPILADLADWFEEQIKACDSIDNIQLDKMIVAGSTYERLVSIEGQLLAYRLLKQFMEEKYNEFKEWQEK